MSPHPRRSSRLRGSCSSPSKPSTTSSRQLSCLTENDESSIAGFQPVLTEPVSSSVIPRTPTSAGCIKPSSEEMHPGKAHSTSSPSFDFRYAHPAPALGPSAQRMMDEIREEALRIKAQLAAQREEERRKAILDEPKVSVGRRIATPKGKVGRFSEVHLAEFKKMDSIAGHASAFRAQPDRFAGATTSLKRSQSKAKLCSREEASRAGNTSSQSQSLESTPAKRVRIAEHQCPVQNDHNNPHTPKMSRSQSFMNSITTPTQASLARAASVKPQSKIPALSQSPSKYSMTAPRRFTKSTTMHNISGEKRSGSIKDQNASPSKFDRFKSILRRPTANIPKPVGRVHTSIHTMTGSIKPNLDKELPSIPSTPVLNSAKTIRHVNVTPRSTIRNITSQQNSPSPVKSGPAPSSIDINLHRDVHYPSLAFKLSLGNEPQKVRYPNLDSTNLGPDVSKHPVMSSPPPSIPGTFTFRSDQTINFGTSPRGFGASPGQSSIRQVRPSIFPGTSLNPSSFPDGNKENVGKSIGTAYVANNKKRRHIDFTCEEPEEVEGSPTKKRKAPATDLEMLMEPKIQAEKMARKSKIPSPSKRGGLSFARLNMLARPKLRK